MIHKLSLKIANFIRNNNDQAASMDVLMFSLAVVLNAILVTLMIVTASIITGKFVEAMILLGSFVILRFFSGGMHLPTSNWCNVISTALFVVLMHLPVTYWYAGLVLNAITLLLVVVFAPTKDIMHLNLLGPKYTPHFKLASIALVAVNFWIQSPLMAMAYFSQALTLLPISYKLAESLERR